MHDFTLKTLKMTHFYVLATFFSHISCEACIMEKLTFFTRNIIFDPSVAMVTRVFAPKIKQYFQKAGKVACQKYFYFFLL